MVILVLGGNPGRLNARAFAINTPNLLNVAVTRARASARYFAELADRIFTWSADEYRGREHHSPLCRKVRAIT